MGKTKRLRSPIMWFGGKGMMVKKITPIILQYKYKTYVEPFGGGASILLALPPVPVEVYNDIDKGLYNFFMVLADPEKFKQFYRRVALLPYSRQLYYECKESWYKYDDPIERAWRWFVVARQSFSGCFEGGWSVNVTASRRKMALKTSYWLSIIELLPELHNRLQRVQIENKDWRDILKQYDTSETLFYLDPPYVHSTRRAGKYAHEMSDEDHRDLVEHLLNLKGMAVLSGYPNDIYKLLEENGWQRIEFNVTCHAVGRTRATGLQGEGVCNKKQRRVECLWVKPSKYIKDNSKKLLSLNDFRKNNDKP